MPSETKPGLNLHLEGLRGIACLLVAGSHLWGTGAFMPQDDVSPWLRHWAAGHGAVLLFFALSGYVIGLTNRQAPQPGQAAAYLKRRAVRLVPIYWLALVLTAVVTPAMPWDHWLAHVTMLQNNNPYFGWLPEPAYYNTPVWSLHYEMVYYLAFLALWWRPGRFGPSMILALGISVVGILFPAALPHFLVGWATGWLFWAGGWWLSRQPPAAAGSPPVPALAGLLLLVANHHLRCGELLAGFLDVPGLGEHAMVNTMNLTLLPCCLLLVGGVAGRAFPGQRICLALAVATPLATMGALLKLGRLHEFSSWQAGAGFTLLGIIVLPWRNIDWLRKFASLGRISYAFYLVHMPLLFLLGAWDLRATSSAQLLLYGTLWFALGVALAVLLELKLQPHIRRRLIGQPPP